MQVKQRVAFCLYGCGLSSDWGSRHTIFSKPNASAIRSYDLFDYISFHFEAPLINPGHCTRKVRLDVAAVAQLAGGLWQWLPEPDVAQAVV